MLKRIKATITSVFLGSMFLMPLAAAVPATVVAQDLSDCEGITGCLQDGADKTGDSSADDAGDRVNNIIRLVINTFSWIVGIISVVMIIIGGLKYITSGGEGSNISGAKNTILYAIIGLVVVALAQIVVQFVLSNVTESSNL